MEHPAIKPELDTVQPVLHLINRLRGDNGCPWDRKQTPKTMSVYLVEEMHELIDAIHAGSSADVCEELGDVLFQLLFLVCLYQEKKEFSLSDVVKNTLDKMIRRHPHVFGEDRVNSSDEVRKRWAKIKQQEKPADGQSGILDSIPRGLPALIRAYRVSERAARSGFDWKTLSGVMKKAEEEWAEFNHETRELPADGENIPPDSLDRIGLEFGDILFTLVNVARFARIHPETALADATHKFEKRFRHMEKQFRDHDIALSSLTESQWTEYWEAAKAAVG